LEEAVKVRNLVYALVLCTAGTLVCSAQDSNLGTWKLNEAKSQIPTGTMKNTTVVYAAEGDKIKVTTDGTRDGKPIRTEWIGKFDGKDYPLTGDPTTSVRTYTRVNDHTLNMANKVDGKVVTSGTITVSPDGKTRVLKVSGTDTSGKKVSSTMFYDKQ
jgi:hypothetical protein